MSVIISMLRGVNVGGHNKIKMEELRKVYESLKLRDCQTYVQSGNVVFRTEERDLGALRERIEKKIESRFGFRPDVIVRTSDELRDAIARNPFAARRGMEPGKLLVTFLASEPSAAARARVLAMKFEPEELRLSGCEVYIYFPNGMGKTKLSWMAIVKALGTTGTGRNWNSVLKMMEMAEKIEARR